MANEPLPEFSREVRMGVVLYGGVSLAIYINGVTHEFYRAVRGLGVYSLLKVLTDSHFIVDIISGTSAGGINGLMLAFALCNRKNFGEFAALWRRHGDIDRLLRDPGHERDQCHSLLDSEGYYQEKLQQALEDVAGLDDDQPGSFDSPVDELDLFITGTDIDGNIYTDFDDAGHEITVKEHRSVFLLKHRPGRKEPFNGSFTGKPSVTYQALGKLARITSCFPGAFAPVHVTQVPAGDDTVDGKLQMWGKLNKEAYFLDGGVLDNKPFTHTLKAIFHRTSDSQVERRLFYVEPDPERFQPVLAPAQPPFFRVIRDSLSGIPGYESIAADLQLLRQHNSQVDRFLRLCRKTQQQGSPEPDSATRNLYLRSRIMFMTARALSGVLQLEGRRVRLQGAALVQARELVNAFEQAAEDSTAEQIGAFDVYFRLRRAFHLSYLIPELLERERDPGAQQQLRGLLRRVNEIIQVLEIFRNWMEEIVDQAEFRWRERTAEEIWRTVLSAYRDFLDTAMFPEPETSLNLVPLNTPGEMGGILSRLNQCLKARVRRTVAAIEGGSLDTRHREWNSVLDRADAWVRAAIPPDRADILEAFQRFSNLDAHLYPMQMVAGLGESDIIDVARISPLDAQQGLSRRRIEEKLSGDSVHHFGGFFKRSWRSNDIMWGRLDGLCELVECLLSSSRLKQVWEQNGYREGARSWIQSLDLNEVFPESDAQARQEIRDWLDDLVSDDAGRREKAVDPDAFKRHQAKLIHAAQLEILAQELPGVYEDAYAEQAEWNRKQREGEWTEYADFQEQFVTAFRARQQGQKQVAESKQKAGLERFFRDSYRVGSETLGRGVPPIVLLHIASRGLLVLRNCIFTALGPAAQAARSSISYRLLLDWPMELAYRYFCWRRGSPQELRLLELILFPAALVAVTFSAIGWWQGRALFFSPGGDMRPLWFLLLFVVPAAVLLVGILRLYGYARRTRWLGPVLITLLIGGGLAAAALLDWQKLILIPEWFGRNRMFAFLTAVTAIGAVSGGALFSWWTAPRPRRRSVLKSALEGLKLHELLVLAARTGHGPGNVLRAFARSHPDQLRAIAAQHANGNIGGDGNDICDALERHFGLKDWKNLDPALAEPLAVYFHGALLLKPDCWDLKGHAKKRYWFALDAALERMEGERDNARKDAATQTRPAAMAASASSRR